MSKIIEYESSYLSRLRDARNRFSDTCDPHKIGMKYVSAIDNAMALQKEIASQETEIDTSFYILGRELRIDLSVKRDD